MRTLLYFLIPFIVVAACKKNTSNVAQPNPPASSTIKFPTDKMNGNWIGIGSGYQIGTPPPPDAFTQLSVAIINDSTILIDGTTVRYLSFDSAAQVIKYDYGNRNSAPYSYAYLYFNTIDNSMEYGYSNANIGYILNTKNYKHNGSLKDYLPDITGPKRLSGVVYDTFALRHPNDSLYSIDTIINFTAINDSTIIFDKDFLNNQQNTLHYKLTNNIEQTIIFQSFHATTCILSTLTYNYVSKSIMFEQEHHTYGWHKYLKLQ